MNSPGSSYGYRDVESLYQAVLDLPVDQRGDYLRRHCSGDRRLRDEVEALLRHYDAAGPKFLDQPPAALRRMEAQAMPERLGRYEIVRLLGEGGMGVVYAARQANPDRTVALKLLSTGRLSPSSLRRFQAEVDALASLHHPGIAHIYEAGTARLGPGGAGFEQPYFAMELIEGAPLTEYARRHELDVESRLRLLAQVCDAVQHAHQRGIIHRDLKPANILVDGAGQPKVLDFGVARVISPDRRTTCTRAGQWIGTLPYMSPELLAGDPSAVDTRCDIYALGVLLYELLADRLPFDVDDLPITEAACRISGDQPPRLSAVARGTSGDLETIVATAMAREPEARYPSAAALAEDIRRHLDGEPIQARRGSTLYVLGKQLRKHKLSAGIAATFILVVTAGFATSLAYWRQAANQATRAQIAEQEQARQRELAQAGERAATLHAERARTVVSLLNEMLDLSNARGPDGEDLTLREHLVAFGQSLEERLRGQPDVEAQVRFSLGSAHMSLRVWDAAAEQFQKAAALRRDIHGELHASVREALRFAVDSLYRGDRREEALSVVRDAIARARSTGGGIRR